MKPQHPAEDKNCLLRESVSVSATDLDSSMPGKLPKPRDSVSSCVVWMRQTTRSRAHLESVKLPCLKDSPKAALASAEPGNSNSTPSSGTFLNSSKGAVLTGSVNHRKSIGIKVCLPRRQPRRGLHAHTLDDCCSWGIPLFQHPHVCTAKLKSRVLRDCLVDWVPR